MFYEFDQNNSGGRFIVNDKVTVSVFIEADSPEEANQKAQDIGIYFFGTDSGKDCECCGDRWRYARDYVNEIDYDNLKKYSSQWVEADQPYAIIYYKNGEVTKLIKEKK